MERGLRTRFRRANRQLSPPARPYRIWRNSTQAPRRELASSGPLTFIGDPETPANKSVPRPAVHYQESAPRPELQPYINCFWMIRSPQPTTARDRTYPDGCQEIVFNVDTTVLRSDDGQTYAANPAVELVGQMSKPYDIVTRGSQLFFGVRFYPHSFARFTRESARDFRDRSIDLRELLEPAFSQTSDAFLQRPSFETFVSSMERYFLNRLASDPAPDRSYHLVDQAVRILLTRKDQAQVDALPSALGVSDRYLQMIFKRHVGLSPKRLLRIIRFQNTLQYLRNSRRTLTEIAHHCGYYDHAHFTHDFNAFTGRSPSAYREVESPLNRFFLTAKSRAYLCDFKD